MFIVNRKNKPQLYYMDQQRINQEYQQKMSIITNYLNQS